ncbi:MAG: nuclear transport factor 2 family protein [Actinomycetota bacterium]
MAGSARELVDEFGSAMEAGDVERLLALYSDRGAVQSYRAAAIGRDAIRSHYEQTLANHGHYRVRSVDQFLDADTLIMWDATVDTEPGVLQTSHVVTLDGDRRIEHHVPLVRGYWGM